MHRHGSSKTFIQITVRAIRYLEITSVKKTLYTDR